MKLVAQCMAQQKKKKMRDFIEKGSSVHANEKERRITRDVEHASV